MSSIGRYIRAIRDYFTKGETGDAAFIEFEVYGIGINSDLAAKLKQLDCLAPVVDTAKLVQLPQETLGYQYARHLKQNQIQPLEISPDLEAEAANNPFALRFTATHDLFHVLLGFDTTYAGETGVFSFAVAQNYSAMLRIIEPIALSVVCLARPHKILQIWKCYRLGKRLGKQAKCLLVYPFEKDWARPLAEVRADLGLTTLTEEPHHPKLVVSGNS